MSHFSENHPAVDLFYFVVVIFFTVTFRHPIFLTCSLFCALSCNLALSNKKALLYFLLMIPFFALLSCLNPLVSHWGDTVLFHAFGNHKLPFTFEALCYGLNMALTFISVIMWFFCYGKVMTSEKFIYLFSKFIPSVSLMLVMIFRLLPSLSARYADIKEARRAAGIAQKTSVAGRLTEGFSVLNTLFVRQLEDTLDTAKSMENRMYGIGKRTFYYRYHFSIADAVLLAAFALLSGLCAFGVAEKIVRADFYPKLNFAPIHCGKNGLFAVFLSFCTLLLIPTLQNIFWRVRFQLKQGGIDDE